MDFSQITPMYDKIIVRPEKKEEKENEMVIPDTAKERPRKGVVVAAGPGVPHFVNNEWTYPPLQAEVGDRIYYGKFAGTEIELEGETFLMLRSGFDTNDVLAVLEKSIK